VGRLGSGPRLVSRIGSEPRLMGRVGSGVRVSDSLSCAVVRAVVRQVLGTPIQIIFAKFRRGRPPPPTGALQYINLDIVIDFLSPRPPQGRHKCFFLYAKLPHREIYAGGRSVRVVVYEFAIALC